MNKEQLTKIRWHCRRGMLELDIILEKFFDEEYLHLTSMEQKTFAHLLSCHDQELYNWFLRKQLPENIELANMVERILLKTKVY